MTPDIDKYRAYVDRFDLTEEQKIELIHTVWQIMENFADRAFGNDPTQLALADREAKNAFGEPPVLDFEKAPRQSETLTNAFHLETEKPRKRKP